MKRFSLLFLIFALFSCTNQNGLKIHESKMLLDNYPIWYFIARSNYVLIAELDLPKSDVDTMFQNNSFRNLEFSILPMECFKGQFKRDSIAINMFVGRFDKKLIDSVNGEKCIFFLTDVSNDSSINNLHVNHVSVFTIEKERFIQIECEAQKRIIDDYSKYYMGKVFKGEKTIKNLIEYTIKPSELFNISDTLSRLDSTYCPAIIKYMNDFRNVEVDITLKNDGGSFEDYRTYGPAKVIDYLDVMLNDQTGCSFEQIHNGDCNDQIRLNTYQGWIIWLYNEYRISSIKDFRYKRCDE